MKWVCLTDSVRKPVVTSEYLKAVVCDVGRNEVDTRISYVRTSDSYVTLVVPPLDSKTGWTGELWSKTKFLILEN